jgi:choline dehydrogenase-like flavoprotein
VAPLAIETEVAVLGGGTSGCVIAGRLTEAGREVLIVEAGPDYGPFAGGAWPEGLVDAGAIPGSHDWGYDSGSRYLDRVVPFQRARVLGGCSAHNGCIAAVGHRSDYDGWGLRGWAACDIESLLPSVLERMRVRAYTDDEAGPFHAACLEAAAAAGWRRADDLCDLVGMDGFGLETVNVSDGVRFNTAFAYLDPVRPSLTVLGSALVDRVERGADGWVAHAVRDEEPLTIRAPTIVLAAGTYGTPAILQRSGIGDPALLRDTGIVCLHELPGVGRNLHDHPMAGLEYARDRRLEGEIEAAAAAGFVPDEQTLGKARSSLAGEVYDLHLIPFFSATQTGIFAGAVTIAAAVLAPRSRGFVHVRSTDPAVAPLIEHAYLEDEEGHDLAVLRDGVGLARELASRAPLRALLGAPLSPLDSDDQLRAAVVHYFHPVGTCAMGAAADPLAVCDARGQVHGLPGLYVGDCSLMPRVPRGNTNIPAVLIGERIAQELLARPERRDQTLSRRAATS